VNYLNQIKLHKLNSKCVNDSAIHEFL